jgi:hypothetical protein
MIIENYNGNLDFMSKYRKGSSFFFNFEIEPFDFKMYKLIHINKFKEFPARRKKLMKI